MSACRARGRGEKKGWGGRREMGARVVSSHPASEGGERMLRRIRGGKREDNVMSI